MNKINISFIGVLSMALLGHGSAHSGASLEYNATAINNIDATTILAITGSLAACKVGYDLYCQSAIEEEVEVLSHRLSGMFLVNLPLVLKAKAFHKLGDNIALARQIFALQAKVNNSYRNWLTPWNWTSAQVNAAININNLAINVLHAKISLCTTNEEIVSTIAMLYGFNEKPLMSAIEDLNISIASNSRMYSFFNESFISKKMRDLRMLGYRLFRPVLPQIVALFPVIVFVDCLHVVKDEFLNIPDQSKYYREEYHLRLLEGDIKTIVQTFKDTKMVIESSAEYKNEMLCNQGNFSFVSQ